EKTSATERVFLTEHKPEPHVRSLTSQSTTLATPLATPLIIYCSSFMSFSGWLLVFLAGHRNAERHRSGGPICLRPDPMQHCLPLAPSIRVHDAGHAAHYILHLSRVLIWLAACPPRMALERRATPDWLRPARTNMSAP
uniref:Frizzled domain-containing protein n=1 Tax=Mesocestoides corti TaxID=53468 RepID=A0A5K3FSJ6_MESCO